MALMVMSMAVYAYDFTHGFRFFMTFFSRSYRIIYHTRLPPLCIVVYIDA